MDDLATDVQKGAAIADESDETAIGEVKTALETKRQKWKNVNVNVNKLDVHLNDLKFM